MSSQLLNWPDHLDRTPAGDRENTTKFSTGFRKTKKDLRDEMRRMDVDEWRLEDVSGSGGDPGVVVRWRDGGKEYAVGCDKYTAKGDNLRELYLWINETRMREQRPVESAQDNFAAAQLPSGGPVEAPAVEPHVILGVAPDAGRNEIKQAFRERAKKSHADQGGSTERMVRLKNARDKMLEGLDDGD